jgi:hypothetical protein
MTQQIASPKKVGIIGEHPNNDAVAMIALLERYKYENVHFEPIDVKNFHGAAMLNHTFASVLASQLYDENFDHVIIMCDLDFKKDKHKREKDKIKDRDKWFVKVNKSIDGVGIFFLIIYELETLILCDLETLDKFFQTKVIFEGKPIEEKDPKSFLQAATKNTNKGRYKEEDAIAIFKKIRLEKIYQNHQDKRSFQVFADQLKTDGLIDFSDNIYSI